MCGETMKINGIQVNNVPEYAVDKTYFIVKTLDHVVWFHDATDDPFEADRLVHECLQPEAFLIDRTGCITPRELEDITAALGYCASELLEGANGEYYQNVIDELASTISSDLCRKVGLHSLADDIG